ncbi:hypothetical protein I3760_01G098100 [Carya illinoinensis]|nr:hypothetical protein I3760_01G098100 [Carya illinoinensis]
MSAQRDGRRQEINPESDSDASSVLESGQDIEGQDCCTKIKLKQYFLNWNLILLASCMYAIAVDSLFFFVLMIKEDEKCLLFHNTLYFVAIGLRSVADLISLANIILEF